ncbi:MAG: hypothetical protein JW772_03180 [Candidatus Diapherotrites archaeon]|nr:hypothetical protein [Candidatus Diapherotrites archaeon]
MNAPKEFWTAAIFGIVILSSAMLIGQANNLFGEAQAGNRITGTIIMRDIPINAGEPNTTVTAIALPGNKCDILITGCGGKFGLWDPDSKAQIPNDFAGATNSAEVFDAANRSTGMDIFTPRWSGNYACDGQEAATKAEAISKMETCIGTPGATLIETLSDNAEIYAFTGGNFLIRYNEAREAWQSGIMASTTSGISSGNCFTFKAKGIAGGKNYVIQARSLATIAMNEYKLHYMTASYVCTAS